MVAIAIAKVIITITNAISFHDPRWIRKEISNSHHRNDHFHYQYHHPHHHHRPHFHQTWLARLHLHRGR